MGNQNLKENQMKFTFAVATIATLSQAYYLDEFVKDAPRGMGRPINRFEGARGEKKVLDEPYDYSSLPKKCVGRVKQFDRYCHNVGKFRKDGRKYSDYRDDDLQCGYCEMGEDGLCIDRDEEPNNSTASLNNVLSITASSPETFTLKHAGLKLRKKVRKKLLNYQTGMMSTTTMSFTETTSCGTNQAV